jgi:tRNA-dihydrouridine synthase
MATLSHEALRILIHRYGDPDEYFSEMIHAPSFVAGGMFEPWYVRSEPVPDRMVWQLTGSDPESMIKAAGMLVPYGGIGLDLNMGCSAPNIATHGAGIAWMRKPLAEVAALVGGVRKTIDDGAAAALSAGNVSAGKLRLSVKLRLGEDEDYARLLAFCRMLVGEGTELITLHPRVRKDKYGRPARRQYVARLASDLSVPVYGNGDVDSAANALQYMEKYPCAGLMIGRAAIQKPWIFGEIRRAAERRDGVVPGDGVASLAGVRVEPVQIDHLEVARFFLEMLESHQPPEFHISRAHRFFFYYCDNFSFAHHIKMKIQRAENFADILFLLEDYFDKCPNDRFANLTRL